MPKIEKKPARCPRAYVHHHIVSDFRLQPVFSKTAYVSVRPLFHDLPVANPVGVGKPCCGVWAPVPICPVLGVLGVPAAE